MVVIIFFLLSLLICSFERQDETMVQVHNKCEFGLSGKPGKDHIIINSECL